MREVSLEDAGENGFVMSADALQIPGYVLTLREGICQRQEWFVGLGCDIPYVVQWKGKKDYAQYEMPLNIILGDDRTVPAVGHGTMWLNMTLKTGVMKKRLSLVLHVPNMACNIFST